MEGRKLKQHYTGKAPEKRVAKVWVQVKVCCIENSCNYILSLYYLYSYVHFVLFEFNDGDWFEIPLDYLMSIFRMSKGIQVVCTTS